MTATWWEAYERGRIARRVMPFPAQTRGEHLFKAAALGLILDGKYPSGRQVLKRLGKIENSNAKVNLNGRQCQWLAEIRELFAIEPYLGYSNRAWREEMKAWYPYKLRRGPKGSLVVCDDWIDNRIADEKAARKQEVGW